MAETDLSHHFRVLKQFLDISDDSSGRNKSNSSRAARAREKLLKLSSAQFCELSTDVFDELKRRIDESRSEPDFLLPRSTFHPKRNQARQKLSSLPQSRFKDLVSDISYEIERRDLHRPASEKAKSSVPERHASQAASTSESLTSSNSQLQQKSRASHEESFDRSLTDSSIRKQPQSEEQHTSPTRSNIDSNNISNSTSISEDLHVPEKKDAIQKQAIGIQPTTVVPAKANMTWSSDEESDNADEAEANDDEIPRRLSLSNTLNHTRSNASATTLGETRSVSERTVEQKVDNSELMREMAALTSSHDKVKREYEDAQNKHKSLASDFETLLRKHETLASEHADLQTKFDSVKADNDRMSSESNQNGRIQKELDELKSTNASLRLENQSLKTEKKRHSLDSREISSTTTEGQKPNGPTTARDISQSSILMPTSTDGQDVNTEIRRLHEKLESVPVNKFSRSDSHKEEQLRNEVSQWQKKFESLKSDHILQSTVSQSVPKDLNIYLSPTGVVPFKLAARFFALVESFFVSLETPEPDSDLLFEKISSIAIIANKISLQGDHSAVGVNRHADTIRDAASHALTATRYYATYSNLMPKIIVERAVAEVAFATCDSISVFKLLDETADSTPVPLRVRGDKGDDFSSMAKPLRITPKKQTFSEPLQVDRGLNTEQKLSSGTFQNIGELPDYAAQTSPTDEIKSKSPVTPITETGIIRTSSPQKDSFVKSKGVSEKIPPRSTSNGVTPEKPIERAPVTPPRPAKLSILDKMKQFEKPQGSVESTESASAKKATIPSDERSVQDSGDSADDAPKDAHETIPVRSKSIFQSLRDRFTGDNTTTPVESAPKEERDETQSEESHAVDAKPREVEDNSQVDNKVASVNGQKKVLPNSGHVDPVEKKIVAEVASNDESSLPIPKVAVKESQRSDAIDDVQKSSEPTQSIREIDGQKRAEKLVSPNPEATNTSETNSLASEYNDAEKIGSIAHSRNTSLNDAEKTGSIAHSRNTSFNDAEKTGSIAHSRNTSLNDAEKTGSIAHSRNTSFNDAEKTGSIAHSRNTSFNDAEKTGSIAHSRNASGSRSTSKSVQRDADERSSLYNESQHADSLDDDEPKFFDTSSTTETVEPIQIPNNSGQESSSNPRVIARSIEPSEAAGLSSTNSFAPRKTSFKVKKVNYQEPEPEPEIESEEEEEEEDSYDEEEDEMRQRQDYRKSMAAATFNFDLFDIDDPDNTLTQVLLYLEHQTVQVISTIQDLLSAIKKPDATRGELRENSAAISEVIRQMTEATNTSMNQTRNHQLKEHGSWVVKSLDDCNHRMHALCKPNSEKDDSEFADRHFKQRLAGISFDIAKCTKELVKTVEEASLKEDIAHLDAKLNQVEDLT